MIGELAQARCHVNISRQKIMATEGIQTKNKQQARYSITHATRATCG